MKVIPLVPRPVESSGYGRNDRSLWLGEKRYHRGEEGGHPENRHHRQQIAELQHWGGKTN